MTALGRLLALALADYRERVRRHGFLVALALSVYAANGFLPPNHAPYATLQMAGHRGLYGSAFVGTVAALLTSVFLGLIGFYLVKNAIERDRETRVGEVLAATPLGRLAYVSAKVLSNFAVLAALTGVVALAALAVQLVRAEDPRLDPAALLLPFLLLTAPTLLLVAAVAVLFETLPGLRGGLGNVAYYFLWSLALVAGASRRGPRAAGGNDLLALGQVLPQLQRACQQAFPDYDPMTGGLSLGLNFHRSGHWDLTTFPFAGVEWTRDLLLGRLAWVGVAVAMTAIAALTFDRFDAGRSGQGRERDRRERQDVLPADRPIPAATAAGPAALARLRPLAAAALRAGTGARFAGLLAAEVRLATRGLGRFWWLVLAGLLVAAALVPLAAARRFVLPLLWIWPVLVWSPLGSRERRHGVDLVLFSTPHPLRLQLLASWLAGVLVALGASLPIGVRLAASGQAGALLGWLAGGLFIPALALCLGTWTGSPRAFEALYTALWYIGPLQPVAPLDFMAASDQAVARGMPAVYLGIALALVALAAVGRRRQLRT